MSDITFEFATHDDCLDKLVPSDLRALVAERDRLIARNRELEERAASSVQSALIGLASDIRGMHAKASKNGIAAYVLQLAKQEEDIDCSPT